ncbi:hypothetical protein ABTX34_11100 [Streptomyces sp. NPDC096538]|uniref:hypothetical protein n=1 Tax=Streptomyces sp. NPDC096538 TaxID=3155427 RepID=UPI00331D61A0
MSGEELLALARKHMWAAWQLSAEELASQAASTLLGLGMLVPEGGAAELEKLRARVAELEAERHTTNEALSEAAEALRRQRDRIAQSEAQREALVERLRAGQEWRRGRTPELVSENYVSQSELRDIFGIPLAAPWAEDPCHPCGCPKRFDRHAWDCPTLAVAETGGA